MYSSFTLNGIRSVNPLDLGVLRYFEASLRCSYGECKRRLHGLFIKIIGRGVLATYELLVKDRERLLARVYVNDDGVVDEARRVLRGFLEGDFVYVGARPPSHAAVEVFFDLLVDAALRRAGFRYTGGVNRMIIDPVDHRRYIKKRTIIEVREHGSSIVYHGILFIDYSMISRSSLADKLLEELDIDEFSYLEKDIGLRDRALELALKYIGSYVTTLVKRRKGYEYVYGEITGIEPVFAYEKKLSNNLSIYDLWINRFREDNAVKLFIETKPDRWEFPLFKVKIGNRPRDAELVYPPSLLKVYDKEAKRPDPSTRWDNIRKIMRRIENSIKEIYNELFNKTIEFRYIKYYGSYKGSGNVGIKPNFYTGSAIDRSLAKLTVKLRYRAVSGGEKDSHVSPIFAFSRWAEPYAGKVRVKLLVYYPSSIDEKGLEKFIKYVRKLFEELRFGYITGYFKYSYRYEPRNLSESLYSFEKILENTLSMYSRHEYLPLIIIPDNEYFYRQAKTVASDNGFHSQLLRINTYENILKNISDIEKNKATKKPRSENALKTLLANMCGGIYVEFLIQRSVARGGVSGPLTWILASPADGDGSSMYVGLDVSTKKGVEGAAFILLDPLGRLIDAKKINLKSEVLGYQDYYDILRYMVSKARDNGLRRIVILRDGAPRTPSELDECCEAFRRVTGDLGYNVALDYVSVIKNTGVRVFADKEGGRVNPLQGTYIYLYRMRHFSYYAHEVVVVASRPGGEEGEEGTARPIILRIYEVSGKNNNRIDWDESEMDYMREKSMRIAEEYLALTRLNFWNLVTGASRLALPIQMADKLSYMLSMGIPVRTR